MGRAGASCGKGSAIDETCAKPLDRGMDSIEEQIAHLTRTVDDLSEVVTRQEREIALLTHRVQLLLEREAEREQDQGGSIALGDQPPPHW